MSKKLANEEFLVIRTFDTSNDLKRAGQIVTFRNKKEEAYHLEKGYVEKKKVPAPKKTTEKNKAPLKGKTKVSNGNSII